MSEITDQNEENAAELLQRLGMDGDLWAREFVKLNPESDLELMRSWFCNSIMAGYDHARCKLESKLDIAMKALEDIKDADYGTYERNTAENALEAINEIDSKR